MRTALRAVICCIGLIPVLISTGPQAVEAQVGGEACLIAGNGSGDFGPFPAQRSTFAGFGSVQEIRADATGAVYALLGNSFGTQPNGLVRVDASGATEIVALEGATVAGVTIGKIVDFELTRDGDVLLLTVGPNALVRIAADGTETDQSAQVGNGFVYTSIAAAVDGTTIYATARPQDAPGAFLFRLDPNGGPPLGLLTPISQIDGEAVVTILHAAAGIGGAWVVVVTQGAGAFTTRLVFVGDDFVATVAESFAPGEPAPSASRADDAGDLVYALAGEVRKVSLGNASTLVQPLDELVAGRVPRFARAIDFRLGTLWVGTLNQIYRMSGGGCPPVPFNDGPTACVVVDQSVVSSLLSTPPEFTVPFGIAVDGAGVIHSTWSGGVGSGGISDEVVLRTDATGLSSVVLAPGELIDGVPISRGQSIAVTETTGEVFVQDPGDDFRFVRQTAGGDWSTFLSAGDVVGGAPLRRSGALVATDNDTVYFSEVSTGRVLAVDLDTGNSRVVGNNFDQVVELAASADTAPEPTLWAVDRAFTGARIAQTIVYRQAVGGGAFVPVVDFNATTLNGAQVGAVWSLAAERDSVIAAATLEGGTLRIIRIGADGTITPIIDELMLVDGRIIDFADLDVGTNGDIYIADRSHGRVIRLPASGDCATPLPQMVDVAASVNCDDEANVIDALFIVQYETTVRTGVYGCPLANPAKEINLAYGDVNGDGAVNVIDALQIAQCDVGVPNRVCPAS